MENCFSVRIELIFIALLFAGVLPVAGQTIYAAPPKYWIYFEDTAPVSDGQLAELVASGAEIIHSIKWLNAVSARLFPNERVTIEALSFVDRTEPVASMQSHMVESPSYSFEQLVTTQAITPLVGSLSSGTEYGTSLVQLEAANVLPNLEQGIIGTGVKLGIIDTGIGSLSNPAFAKLLEDGRLTESRDFTGVPDDGNRHAEYVLSVAAGFLDGQLVGPAYGADIYHARTEVTTTETHQEEDNLVAALEWMVAEGVDVINISLSYTDFDLGFEDYERSDMDGETAVSTRAVNIAVESGAVVVVAAGNHATLPSDPARCSPPKCWYYVGSPADAFDNVTVGATTPQDEKASFSAFGPTFDGRTKPEVSAMGTNITYAKSSLNPGCDGEVCTTGNGTSFSAPMVAGIVAQMLQVDPGLTPAEVKLVLTQTARIPVSGDAATAEYPNDSLGFGIVDAAAAVAMVTAVGSHVENPLQPHYSKPYPNPARDRVYFATTGHQEPNPMNIRFFDVLGREVLNRIFDQRAESTHRIEIDTSHLLTGIYVYRIVSNGSTASTGKIVVTQ